MERERAVLNHGDFVQPFLKDAFKEGAHRIKPKYVRKDQWFRQTMIGVVYNDIGSTATVKELGEKHGLFRQQASDTNKRFLRNLWNNSSPEVQGKYPLNEILSARKPLSQRSRERISLGAGGRSLEIRRQVENGMTDIDTLSKNTGIPKKNIATAISTTLKKWDVIVPGKHSQNKQLLMEIERETDDEKIQGLLDRIRINVVLRDLEVRKEASRFFGVFNLIKEAGFRHYRRDVHIFAF